MVEQAPVAWTVPVHALLSEAQVAEIINPALVAWGGASCSSCYRQDVLASLDATATIGFLFQIKATK